MSMTVTKAKRMPIKAAFCFRLMVAMTGAPQCGHVRAWSLTCPLHSWHLMRAINVRLIDLLSSNQGLFNTNASTKLNASLRIFGCSNSRQNLMNSSFPLPRIWKVT